MKKTRSATLYCAPVNLSETSMPAMKADEMFVRSTRESPKTRHSIGYTCQSTFRLLDVSK